MSEDKLAKHHRRLVMLEDQYQRVFSAVQRMLCCTVCQGQGAVLATPSMQDWWAGARELERKECECRRSARVDILGIKPEAWPPPESNR